MTDAELMWRAADSTDATVPRWLVDEVRCAVCLDTATLPHETNCCGQVYCEECLGALQRCPSCRAEPLQHRPNRSLERVIAHLPVACDVCGELVERARLNGHKDSRHPEFVNCVFCGVTIVRRLLGEHEQSCVMRPVHAWFPNLRFGMSVIEVWSEVVGRHAISDNWSNLPVAREITNYESRYLWINLERCNRVVEPGVFSALTRETRPDRTFMCFMFERTHGLHMISFRTYDTDSCVRLYRRLESPLVTARHGGRSDSVAD
ncbi:hypothetical protein HK405_009668 [Cladochytrium tenue]|nr:hypothetical protein HK405_009668 [Cladochytrium tenue]